VQMQGPAAVLLLLLLLELLGDVLLLQALLHPEVAQLTGWRGGQGCWATARQTWGQWRVRRRARADGQQ
jgi:hypothetical protein